MTYAIIRDNAGVRELGQLRFAMSRDALNYATSCNLDADDRMEAVYSVVELDSAGKIVGEVGPRP